MSLRPPGLYGHLEGGQGTSLTYPLQLMTVMEKEDEDEKHSCPSLHRRPGSAPCPLSAGDPSQPPDLHAELARGRRGPSGAQSQR